MKSAAMTLANGLYKQLKDRRQALTKAWAIIKAGEVTSKVAGVGYENRQDALHRLMKYPAQAIAVKLVHEDIPQDSNAVAVMISVNGGRLYRLGYLPRTLAAVWSALVKKGKAAAKFESVVGGAGLSYGARLKIRGLVA